MALKASKFALNPPVAYLGAELSPWPCWPCPPDTMLKIQDSVCFPLSSAGGPTKLINIVFGGSQGGELFSQCVCVDIKFLFWGVVIDVSLILSGLTEALQP